jgi:hypothetical protein
MAAVVEARRSDGTSVVWVDRKRRLWLLAFVVPTLPIVATVLATRTGWPVFWFWGPIFAFVLVPLADVLVGDDPSNPPEEVAAALQADPWYRWIVLAYLPAQFAVIAWTLWYAGTHDVWVFSAVVWAVALALGGRRALVVLGVQAVIGFSLLEGVNYVEHYGLLRRKDERGRYERVTPRHSWNNNHVVTNLLLYQLQRHSDHHENPARRFVALRHVDEAPQLPAGYAAMILLALIPPLWRRVMDPRLLAHYGGDLSLANTH